MKRARRFLPALAVVLGIVAACSAKRDDATPAHGFPDGGVDGSIVDDGGGGFEIGGSDAPLLDVGDAAAAPMRIEPSDLVVMMPGGKPATVPYSLSLLLADGTSSDITVEATWSLADPSLGSFAGNVLTATKEGKTMVRASARGMTVETSVEIRGPVVIVAPGAPGDAPSKFGGAVDPSRAPSWVYPDDGVIVPPNMNVMELHFMPGSGNGLFEIGFEGAAVDVKVYTSCTAVGSGCVYTPDATVWKLVAEGGRGKDPISFRVRGVAAAGGSGVGVSASRKIAFAEESLEGGIYYWNAAAGATMRYEFGVSGKTGEVYMNAPAAGAATCVGCHTLSRNGQRIALGLDIPAPSPYKVYEVATKTQLYAQGTAFGGGANFFTFSPDAAQIVTSNAITLVLRDAKTGAAIKDPLANPGAMPDWSPDGKRIVYAKPGKVPPCFGGFCGSTGVDDASIETLAWDGTKWAPGKTVAPFAGQNNYYPSFSPDGAWVVFNRSPSNQNSYDAPDAKVFLASSEGGAAIDLAKASTGGDSWPKWMPRVQKHRGGNLMWITFSSRRAYGLRLASGAQAQIWMTAIDPAKAKAGADASWPAFWLPFQDLASGNHIAQWVTKVERKPCSAVAECASGEQCIGGVCRPVIK